MAIQLYCQGCRSYVNVSSKKCPKCETVFSREGRKYRVDVSVKGKRVTRFVDNLTIAREVEAAIKGDLVRGEYDIEVHKANQPVTIGDVWEKYLPWAREHKRSFDTDLGYYKKHIEPRFGRKALGDITPIEIERLKSEMKRDFNSRGKPYAAATIKHQIVLLRRLFNVARKWGMYDGANPVERVQMPKVDNQRTEFLTEDELDRLLETLDNWPFPKSAALVRFALLTGLRRGEICKLTWSDVDFERNMVTLKNPKGGRTATIPLSRDAMAVLRSMTVVSSDLVFPGENGRQRADFKGPWQRIRKASQLPEDFRFHGLRHHFASTLVSNGVDLGIVRELLTHRHVSTTEKYAHFAPDAVRRAADRSGELLTGRQGAKVLELKQ
jgi:integrase